MILMSLTCRHRLFGENKTKNNLIECSSIKSNEFNGGELVVFGTGDKYGDIELVDEYTINLESIIKDRHICSWFGESNFEKIFLPLPSFSYPYF